VQAAAIGGKPKRHDCVIDGRAQKASLSRRLSLAEADARCWMREWSRLLLFAFFLSPWNCLAENTAALTASESESLFLERMMAVESNGRLSAKNQLSSALGPYQFVRDTFLDVIKRRFPQLANGKTDEEILALRTDLTIARNAALTCTRENANYLAAHGKPVTAGHLRLAFFVGPGAALKVLEAAPEDPLTGILSEAALSANPSLGKMTAGQLIDRAIREAGGFGATIAVAASPGSAPPAGEKHKIAVQCNLKLPGCRKWLELAEKRLALKEARVTPAAVRR
jgi:hypothetical protein